MPRLLSLPPELHNEIIEMCPNRERCNLRSTNKILSTLADPIVFRRLHVYSSKRSPHITEHQIIALVTRSSKACEFTKELAIFDIPNGLRASEQSWPHFGKCDDLMVHLPTAISALRNVTSFRWVVTGDNPAWLVGSIIQAVACLPNLAELIVETLIPIPLGRFANLSKLFVRRLPRANVPFFISQLATVIANSPGLRSLSVSIEDTFDGQLPTLSELFAKLARENPLYLEHLHIGVMDATVDQAMLPHLTQLISFNFAIRERDVTVSQSVWTSLLVNNVKLTDLEINGIITEETMLYLSSFSGLKRLALGVDGDSVTAQNAINMLTEALPKHAHSLETLKILGDYNNKWVFNHSLKPIMECHKLRDLFVCIDFNVNSLESLLHTVARLPELEILRCIVYVLEMVDEELKAWVVNFEPVPGLRYVKKLEVDLRRYVLEKVGERSRYVNASH